MRQPLRYFVASVVTLVTVLAAIAQNGGADEPAGPLAAKQQMILDRLARLEDRMFRLRESLSESEPENARKLGETLRRASELDLQARVDAIVAALQAASRLDDASQQQEDLVRDYQALLDTLLDRNPEDARKREAMQRLAKIKEELENLRQRQTEARQTAADAIRAQRLARRIDKTIQQIRKLIQEQKNLAEPTGKPKPDTKPRASAQAELVDRARRIAEQIEQMAETKAENVEDALNKAADNTSSSADDMQEATEKLKAEDENSAKSQQRASEKLQQAIERLQEAKGKLDTETPNASAERQRAIAEDTQKLAQRMKGEESEQGKPQSSEQQAPGTENVERAKQHMQKAAGELDGESPEQAAQDQDMALDELERAQQQIEEELKQKRKEEQEEILRSLQSRLEQMIAQQTAVNTQSEALHEKGSSSPNENFTRADSLECAQLADRQTRLAQDGETCVRLLEEDGTTVVFPQVMQQVVQDMHTIAQRLSKGEVDALTIAVQADVRTTLEDLLESLEKLRKEQQEQQAAGGGSGGGGGGDAPLVPTSAELKMLKSAQRRINTLTAAAGEISPDKSDDKAETLRRAAQRQAELVQMAREMQKRSEKEHP